MFYIKGFTDFSFDFSSLQLEVFHHNHFEKYIQTKGNKKQIQPGIYFF